LSKPLRVGFIGTGKIAAAVAEDLGLTDSCTIVAVGSRQIETANQFADRFAIPTRHASYEALVADPDVELVYITTPHPMHHPNVRLALEAGKPVLVEKPFTMNANEARDLVALAREKGLFLMEAMWTRFLPHVVEIRRVIADGAIGDVINFTGDHGQAIAPDRTHRIYAPELGGSALLDLGIYPVSFASMLLGTPERVMSVSEPTFTGVDGQTSMLFGYASGAQALLSCTLFSKSPTRGVILGTKGRIEIDSEFYRPTRFTVIKPDAISRYDVPHEGWGLRHQFDAVARCLAAKLHESPVMPLDESISIMETIDIVLSNAGS
jgi:predicted dehydrogenase